jgi:DNA-binding PadR family transcriptional regulator
MKIVTRSDEILMLAILRLKDNAYGVSIIKEVQKRTGKKLTFGSLWVSLDILHKRGFVKKIMADPTPQRGGRSKIFYSLSPKGIRALEEAREFQKTLWEGLSAQLKT